MFDKKVDYAFNKKDKNAIVYKDAYDNIIRLTASDFSSIKEFRKWKNWAKMKGHTEEKKEHIYRNHTVSMTGFEEFLESIPSLGVNSDHQEHDNTDQQNFLLKEIRSAVTETQFRRLWMYYAEGMDTYEIATVEGRCHQAISQSLDAAWKNILLKLSKSIDKTSPNRR